MSFQSTSTEYPSILHVSFAKYGPNAQLGAKLINCDIPTIDVVSTTTTTTATATTTATTTTNTKDTNTTTTNNNTSNSNNADKYMFTPGYAIVDKLINSSSSTSTTATGATGTADGGSTTSTTVAQDAGVQQGDIIIAVNGLGFRRFAQDYKDDEITIIDTSTTNNSNTTTTSNIDTTDTSTDITEKDDMIIMNHRVVPNGGAYNELLTKIKAIKAANNDPPLVLTFERYTWDARPNSWYRFLQTQNNNVINAMQMIQEHELWKQRTFPIDLITRGIQKLIREKVISEIDISISTDAVVSSSTTDTSPGSTSATTKPIPASTTGTSETSPTVLVDETNEKESTATTATTDSTGTSSDGTTDTTVSTAGEPSKESGITGTSSTSTEGGGGDGTIDIGKTNEKDIQVPELTKSVSNTSIAPTTSSSTTSVEKMEGSVIDVSSLPRTVYINYSKVLTMKSNNDCTMDEIIQVFIVYIERQLLSHTTSTAKNCIIADPRTPKVNIFIDLTNLSITTSGFRVDIIKQLYTMFEPNYPQILHKMIFYPVSTMMATTLRTWLSFVTDRKKFIMTNSLDMVSTELGWDYNEVQECGTIYEFMCQHEKANSLYYD